MVGAKRNYMYLPYYRPRQRYRIVTFRVSPELNELIALAAKKSGKSKSEFIRESIVEFIKFLEDSVGVEASLQRHLQSFNERSEGNRKVYNSFVVLV